MAMHKKNGKNGKNGGMNKRVSVDRENTNKLGKGGKMQTTNGLTECQKKLPPALRAAILKKKKGKK